MPAAPGQAGPARRPGLQRLRAGQGGTGYGTGSPTLTLAPSGNAAIFNAEALTNTLVIIDNTKNWIPNEHMGKMVLVQNTAGYQSASQIRRIVANTSRTLLVSVALTLPVSGQTQYTVYDPKIYGVESTINGDCQQYSWGVASGGTTGTLVDAHTGVLDVSVVAGGTGYSENDTMTLDVGTGATLVVTDVDSGAVKRVIITNPGTGYTAGTTYATTSGDGGTGCTILVNKLDGKNWVTNMWAGKKVKIIAGKGVNSFPNEVLIASNTSDTLTFSTNWTLSEAPDTTTVYAIMDNWGVVTSAGLTLTATNGVVTGVPANASVNTAGTGYVVGDVLWVNGGTAVGCFVKVLTLSGSGVATFTVLNPGSGLATTTNYSSVNLTGAGTGFILASGAAVSTAGTATTINDPFQLWGVSNYNTKILKNVAGNVVTPGTEYAISTSTYNQLTIATTTTALDATHQYAIYSTLPRPTAVSIGVSNFMNIWGAATPEWDVGRYFLSWRGCGTSLLERYDVNNMIWDFISVGGAITEVHTLGSMFVYDLKNRIYFVKGGDTTGRVMYYDITSNTIVPCGQVPYGMGAGVQGCRMFVMSNSDLKTADLEYLYIMRQTGQEFWRALVYW